MASCRLAPDWPVEPRVCDVTVLGTVLEAGSRSEQKQAASWISTTNTKELRTKELRRNYELRNQAVYDGHEETMQHNVFYRSVADSLRQ